MPTRLTPPLVSVATFVAATFLCGLGLYLLGARSNDKDHYLKNYRAPNNYETNIYFAMGHAMGSKDATDVLFLGDSTCVTDLRPVSFESRSGLAAYNLGTVGVLGLDGYALTLRTYLQHHPAPRLVVLATHPWAASAGGAHAGPQEIREQFLRTFGDAGAAAPTRSDYVHEGVWYLYGLASGGLASRANEVIPFRDEETLETLALLNKREKGYWASPRQMAPPPPHRAEIEGPFDVAESTRADADVLAELAAEHGILLMVRMTPAVAWSGAETAEALESWLTSLAERHANVIVGRPEVLRYDRAEFSDLLHLNVDGAARLTAVVADEVSHLPIFAAATSGTVHREREGRQGD